MKTPLLVGIVVALVYSVAGCGTGDHRSGGIAADSEHAKDPELSNLVLPLDRFDLTEDELEITTKARYLLTQRCVGRYGETLPAREPGDLRAPRIDRYGLADEHVARTWAYSLDAPLTSAIPWEATIRPDSKLFPLVHGDGTGEEGCRSEANRILTRGTQLDEGKERNPIPGLDDRAWRASLASSRVQKASQAWQRCMAKDGYSYKNPTDAPYFYWGEKRIKENPRPTEEQRKHGIRPTEAERKAALSDVRCKHESGFLRIWVAADIAAQQRLIKTNERVLQSYRRSLDILVRNAKIVLSHETSATQAR